MSASFLAVFAAGVFACSSVSSPSVSFQNDIIHDTGTLGPGNRTSAQQRKTDMSKNGIVDRLKGIFADLAGKNRFGKEDVVLLKTMLMLIT